MLGEPVPVHFVLARSEEAVIEIQHLTAFPNGFEFEVVAHYRQPGPVWDPMHGLAGLRGRPGDRYGELSDEHLRLGIQFPDGSRATNVGPPMITPPGGAAPWLVTKGGSASPGIVHATFWVWPLPPAGPLLFVCEWPRYGVGLTHHELEGDQINRAGQRASVLWDDAAQDDGPGGKRQ
jgi:hypothetical protein